MFPNTSLERGYCQACLVVVVPASHAVFILCRVLSGLFLSKKKFYSIVYFNLVFINTKYKKTTKVYILW